MREQSIPDSQLQILANRIRTELYSTASTFSTTVFLCGADISQKDKLRAKVANLLNAPANGNLFDIVYPEEIFDEILYNSKGANLLSLENLLAESVDVIVIIPESPGSFTELGAFVNDEKLRNKVICIIDNEFERKKSFINQGPVKLVKAANPDCVIYADKNDLNKIYEKLTKSIRKIKKNSSKKNNKISLIQLNNFLLPAIYLLEPINKVSLQKLVGYANEEYTNVQHITTAALTVLQKKRQIELTSNGYKLTSVGLDAFWEAISPPKHSNKNKNNIFLDNLRLEVLNLTLRRKKLRI